MKYFHNFCETTKREKRRNLKLCKQHRILEKLTITNFIPKNNLGHIFHKIYIIFVMNTKDKTNRLQKKENKLTEGCNE
jgi:hypothetical protein